MFLYNKKTSYLLISGLVFMHLLCLCLSCFFVHRFLIVSFDSSVFALLAILFCGPVIVDISSIRTQALSRFFVRCSFTTEGIVCHGPGLGRWCVEWNKICFYGTVGWSLPHGMPIIFLSTDPNEKYESNSVWRLTHQRVIFEVQEEIMRILKIYMPTEMTKCLETSINTKKDSFFRKNIRYRTGDGLREP